MLLTANPDLRDPGRQSEQDFGPTLASRHFPLFPIRLLDPFPASLFRFVLAATSDGVITDDFDDEPPPFDAEPDEVLAPFAATAETAQDGQFRPGRDERSRRKRRQLRERDKAGVTRERGREGRRGGKGGEAEDAIGSMREASQKRREWRRARSM